MLYREETPLGMITLRKEIVENIVAEAIKPYDGKVFLGNYKGKLSNLMPKWADGVDVHRSPTGLDVKIYVVLRFGTSIKMVAEELMESIQEKMEETIELPVTKISVVVTGILSKQLVKRNIEVTK